MQNALKHATLLLTMVVLTTATSIFEGQPQSSQTTKETIAIITGFPVLTNPMLQESNYLWNNARSFDTRNQHHPYPNDLSTVIPIQYNSQPEERSATQRPVVGRENAFEGNSENRDNHFGGLQPEVTSFYVKHNQNKHNQLRNSKSVPFHAHSNTHSLGSDQMHSREPSHTNAGPHINLADSPKARRPIRLFPDPYYLALQKQLKEREGRHGYKGAHEAPHNSQDTVEPSLQEDESRERSQWHSGEAPPFSPGRDNRQQHNSQYQSSIESPPRSYSGEAFTSGPDRPDLHRPAYFEKGFSNEQGSFRPVPHSNAYSNEGSPESLEKDLTKVYSPKSRLYPNAQSLDSNRSPYGQITTQSHHSPTNRGNYRENNQHNIRHQPSHPVQKPFLRSTDTKSHPPIDTISLSQALNQQQPPPHSDELSINTGIPYYSSDYSNEKIPTSHEGFQSPKNLYSGPLVHSHEDTYREKMHQPHSDYSNEHVPASHRTNKGIESSFSLPSTDGHSKLYRGSSDNPGNLHMDYSSEYVPNHQKTSKSHSTSKSISRPLTDDRNLNYRDPSHHSVKSSSGYSNENYPTSHEMIQRPVYKGTSPHDHSSEYSPHNPEEFSVYSGPISNEKHVPVPSHPGPLPFHGKEYPPADHVFPVEKNIPSEKYYSAHNLNHMDSRKQADKPSPGLVRSFHIQGDAAKPKETSEWHPVTNSRLPILQQRNPNKSLFSGPENSEHILPSNANVGNSQGRRFAHNHGGQRLIDDQPRNRLIDNHRNHTKLARASTDDIVGMGSESESESEPDPEPSENENLFSEEEHSGFLDMGAYTDTKGSFGWYADFPVGRGHDKVSYSSS